MKFGPKFMVNLVLKVRVQSAQIRVCRASLAGIAIVDCGYLVSK